MLVVFSVTALMAAPLPNVVLLARDARGCGRPALQNGTALHLLRGGAESLCVRDAFAAHLESGSAIHVVLHVQMPEGVAPEQRLFIYRLEGHRLVPRYLGTGPRSLTLLDVWRSPQESFDRLRVSVVDNHGREHVLLCGFEGFVLLCDNGSPSQEES